jgi:two-component system, sensor histidine kinase and response regulator
MTMRGSGPPTAPAGGRPRVLLVDDRPENLLALSSVLEGLHAELVQARSGAEALRRLLHEDFALIILDVQMPTLDGFETAYLIKRRQRTRHIPIIFLTAISGEPEHYLRGYSAGAIDYVHKPFSPEILRAKVSVLLELWHRGTVIERQRAELQARLAELDVANEQLGRQAVELERSNAALERFAEVAAHELRQPLRNVAGFVELWLARQRAVPGGDREALLLAERAAHGLTELRALTDALLAYAKTGTELPRREPVPLAEALEAARRELAPVLEAAGASVEAERLPTVPGDRRLLTQLFANLLDNAVKFGADEPPAVRVRAEPGDGEWKVGVCDNGVGVDPADVPRLFTIFVRLHPGSGRPGHGIGLAVCRRIVERHGGTIWCEPGTTGTTMWFTLPRDAA